MSGWSGRRVMPGNWGTLRKQVLERDQHTCRCGSPATQVDHVVPLAEGGTHDPSNLLAVCRDCHRTKTLQEQARGRARAAARRRPTPPMHPGLLPSPPGDQTLHPAPPRPVPYTDSRRAQVFMFGEG